ncbi:MAG: DNA repair protein RecN [Muribaculaceae bacterium]|nr:DNA repair protein RecN [Muribaculaceae bacterium]
MLNSLHISNYALIDNIDIRFHAGLNIITGETGGGKSIILGALSLLLGERADLRSIGNSERKSVIEAEFDIKDNVGLRNYCRENDIEADDDVMIMRREISPTGRSRSFINDTPVRLEDMKEVGLRLVDIHSQHQNQLLSSPDFQLKIIDSLADNGKSLNEFSELYSSYKTALHKLKATKSAIAKDRENADFMQFQLQRLDELDLQPGEADTLEAEREQIAEAADARERFNEVLMALSAGETNALSLLSDATGALENILVHLPGEAEVKERLDNMMTELADIADTVEEAASAFPADLSSELEAIERRLRRIEDVKDRQGVSSADELIQVRTRLQSRLQRLEDSENILKELEQEARKAKKLAVEQAARITAARKRAAEEFAAVLRETAMPLGMKNLVCEIAVEPTDMSATGADNIEFRFAFNKNQVPVAVGSVASGGEISRMMLSIKSIIAHRMSLPTIIFDEVDTGVSGDVADRMGRMMRDIGENIQVITITHLPQVAAKGEHHFKVFKHDTDTSTVTHIKELSRAERTDELALMLSGDSTNPASRAAAEELLASSIR